MITVNAMGDNCPIPVIKTKKAMDALTGPETIEVLVDNEIAVQNVTKMAQVPEEKLHLSRKLRKNMLLQSRWKEHRRQRMMRRTTIQLL